jgi:hypothetical protein
MQHVLALNNKGQIDRVLNCKQEINSKIEESEREVKDNLSRNLQ